MAALGLTLQVGQYAHMLDEILAATTDLIFVFDRYGKILYANQVGASLFGREASELIGLRWQDLELPGAVLDSLRQVVEAVFATGETRQGETQLATVTGRRDFEYALSPLRASENIVQAVVVTAHDVTVRNRVDHEFAAHLARERALASIAQALVRQMDLRDVVDVVVAQSLVVLRAKAVAVWLADSTRHELTLLAARGFTPSFAEVKQQIPFDSTVLAARAARTLEFQVVEDVDDPSVSLASRQFYKHEGLGSLIALPLVTRGQLVGILGYGIAVPHRFHAADRGFVETVGNLFAVAIENARLYEQVRQALRLREEFMAAAAHELKTPVTVIKGRTQLLLRQEADVPGLRKPLESILRHANRIALLVQDLLAVGKVRPGLTALHRERFDLSALTREQAMQVAQATESETVHLDVDGPLIVDADRSLIVEVLARLLENALRYSLPGTTIDVVARRDGTRAVVSVRDHGVGIARERLAHVFEPFYEVVPPGETGYVGFISLGLYLSKQIIDAHRGCMWVTSVPGQGSTFAFSLPLTSSG